MYHRYQPTENGRFQRQTVPDKSERMPPALPRQKESMAASKREDTAVPIEKPVEAKMPHKDPNSFPPPRFQLPFLEKLLPNMDSGDLLLLLIMLLLISEGNEDASSVVMTLAIFLFLQ